MAVGIAVDRGADRGLLGDELHHDAFEQFAVGGFHDALAGRPASDCRSALLRDPVWR